MSKNNDGIKYISYDYVNEQKTVNDMNSEEKYEHVENMIIGIELVSNSNICVTDYQSNVSRFIKLRHHNFENVYDVENKKIDLENKCCPAYSF